MKIRSKIRQDNLAKITKQKLNFIADLTRETLFEIIFRLVAKEYNKVLQLSKTNPEKFVKYRNLRNENNQNR